MKQLCGRKREREIKEDQSYDSFNLSKNKKVKNTEILFPQKDPNIFDDSKLDKSDKYSSSTLQSKNDFLFEIKKKDILKMINYQNKVNNNRIKMIENSFKENNISYLRELSCPSFYSDNYIKSESSCSIPEETYYPYEIGEIISNKYIVSK